MRNSNNVTLKDLMKKINKGNETKDRYFKESIVSNDTIEDLPSYCMYLDGNYCSEGCSCADIEIEEECPFIQTGEYDNCCCYKPEVDLN